MYCAYFSLCVNIFISLYGGIFFQNVSHSVITVPNFAFYINITNN